jgi:HEAT repeat protein
MKRWDLVTLGVSEGINQIGLVVPYMKISVNFRFWSLGLLALCAGAVLFFLLKKDRYLIVLKPVPDHTIHYQFAYLSRHETASGQGASLYQVAAGDMAATGHMRWQVVEQNAELSKIKADIHFEKLEGMNLMSDSVIPFAFTLHGNGAISDIRFRELDFDQYSFLIMDFLRFFHMQLPAESIEVGHQWSSKEPFRPTDLPLKNEFQKVDKNTFRMSRVYQNMPKVEASGQARITLDRTHPYITQIDLEKRLVNRWPGSGAGTSVTEFHAQARDPDSSILQMFEQKAQIMDRFVSENMRQETLMERALQRSHKKILDTETAETLKEQLREAEGKDRRENMPLYQKLKALLSLQPETAAQLLPFLLREEMTGERFRMAATTLTSVGHEEAQSVLREAIASAPDEARKIRLIPNLSFVGHPSTESEKFLRTLSQTAAEPSLRRTAELALGTIAHQLREHDPRRASSILEEFKSRLSQTTDDDQTLQNLTVVGNIGLVQQLESVKPFLTAKSPRIRQRAYESLRHVPGLEAESLLLRALLSEKEVGLREAIAESLTFKPINTEHVSQVKDVLDSEKNLQVIKHLLRALALTAGEAPEIRVYLNQYSDRCAHPDLCGFVSGLVSSL